MGKTAFAGPAYGSKATLFGMSALAVSSGASTTVYASAIVPPGEDWYLTEVSAFRGSTGSTGFAAVVRDDSTTVSSQALASSLAAASNLTILTPDAGEYEGVRVASGSTVTIELTSPTVASANVSVNVYGFRRWISSTRSEG